MEKRILGKTGLEVTQLGFGAMELRGPRAWGGRPIAERDAEALLNAVLDAGINFIDTSPDYGLSEEFIGRFVSSRRKDYYLATKCGCVVTDAGDRDDTSHTWTRDRLLTNIDESLARLGTDHVDILQIHNAPVEEVVANGLVDVLKQIQQAGKTRFISISTTLPHLPEYLKMGVFDTFQIPYSALERRHEEWITKSAEAGIGIIIRGGVAKGAVSDESAQGPKADIWVKAGMDELLGGMGRSEFMLRFTLSHPHRDTTIVGTLNPEHFAANIRAAAKGPLPPDLYEEAKRRLAVEGNVPE